jgi:hypothetical protein
MDEVYPIIKDIQETGIFTDRPPNKNKPTKDHLLVQRYLQYLCGGTFLGFTKLGPSILTVQNPLYPLIGDWKEIHDSIMRCLPDEELDYKCTIATFFFNQYKGVSWFYTRMQHTQRPDPVIKMDKEDKKRRMLPYDVSRCSEIYCPKRDSCLRAVSPKEGIISYSSFVFGRDGCDYYIGD